MVGLGKKYFNIHVYGYDDCWPWKKFSKTSEFMVNGPWKKIS